MKQTMITLILISLALVGRASDSGIEYTLERADSKTVAYSIYRGNYKAIGATIGRIYTVLMASGISPKGPVSLVYLNNPQYLEPEHWLMEVQIPVDSSTLSTAELDGAEIHIKTVKEQTLVVVKTKEMQTHQEIFYENLFAWLDEQHLRVNDNLSKRYPQYDHNMDYTQQEVIVAVPVSESW